MFYIYILPKAKKYIAIIFIFPTSQEKKDASIREKSSDFSTLSLKGLSQNGKLWLSEPNFSMDTKHLHWCVSIKGVLRDLLCLSSIMGEEIDKSVSFP